jgi:hypothetical protein
MSVPIEDLLSTYKTFTQALVDYNSGLVNYIENPGIGTGAGMVSLPILLGQIDMSSFLTESISRIREGGGHDLGSINNVLDKASSVIKEIGLALMSKSDFYDMAVSEINTQTLELIGDEGRNLNYIRGTSPEQAL